MENLGTARLDVLLQRYNSPATLFDLSFAVPDSPTPSIILLTLYPIILMVHSSTFLTLYSIILTLALTLTLTLDGRAEPWEECRDQS